MGDVIELQDRQLIENNELIADLCRFRENLLTEKFIRRKYRLDNATWERLGSDEGNALVEKVEEESLRRVRDGSAKREKSQQLITKAPNILDSIASDVTASPRHRVDAIKTLDTFAANGPEGVPPADRFQITIVLSADGSGSEPAALHFNKRITPLAPGEVDIDDITPNDNTGVIAALAAKKTDDGNGNAL